VVMVRVAVVVAPIVVVAAPIVVVAAPIVVVAVRIVVADAVAERESRVSLPGYGVNGLSFRQLKFSIAFSGLVFGSMART
jgi:hypothetical protein